MISAICLSLAAALAPMPAQQADRSARASEALPSVVLVHGAVMDGSGWQSVFAALTRRGYRVAVTQLPLTGLNEDVATVRAAIARLPGPIVLVGHSYGGAVISVAGTDPKVRSLVYVAAHQPDVGESVGELNARFPLPAHVEPAGDGKIIVASDHFRADVAADLPAAEAAFLAAAQAPTEVAAFTAKVPAAAWRGKPSWGIVARQDRTLSPALERWMYARSKTRVTELDGSHLVYMSRPNEVAAVIETAAKASDER